MTALSFDELKTYLHRTPDSKRLVVAPLLDPVAQLRENQAAIDVRLGRVFSIAKPWTQGVADEIAPFTDEPSPEPPLETVILNFGQSLIIHPHQFVLARTLEMLRLPADLIAYVIGRSSWGRRGLIVATAVVVHPGFAGPVTLELRNLGETPMALFPLDLIAQLVFHKIEVGTTVPTEPSQFASSFEPSLGRVRKDETLKRITFLAGEYASRREPKADGPSRRAIHPASASEDIPPSPEAAPTANDADDASQGPTEPS
jgi:dCTP deaminase